MVIIQTIVELINALPDLLAVGPASEQDILEAQLQLCLQFAEDYKQYLREFGAIIADGLELTGIAKSSHRSVIAVTMREWERNPCVWRSLYVVENTGVEGVLIWQDEGGGIYQSTPENFPEKIAQSLAEYIGNGKAHS